MQTLAAVEPRYNKTNVKLRGVMSSAAGPIIRSTARSELYLPPPFRLVTLREVGDAFARAQALAPMEGAGTLVWVGRFDLAEFAIVLEPEQPLASARRAFFVAMAALADALAVLAPPEKPITFDYPDSVRVDGGLVGGGRLAWPEGAAEDAIPDWLVFGATIRIVAMGETEPGLHPLSSALEEEGFDGFEAGRLVELFARHLMLHLDAWHEHGFAAVARAYLQRLPSEAGVRRDLDDNGDLLRRSAAAIALERTPLLPALGRAAGYDPATKAPCR